MENVKLMKPLFYGSTFNADGKRMRAVLEREVSNESDAYRIWRSCGVPDRGYPCAENDKYLLYVELHGFLAPLRMTEYDLINHCGSPLAVAELYGDEEGRRKHFDALRKSEQAHATEIPKALEAEDEATRRLGSDPANQTAYIKKQLAEHISTYLEAKENGGESFPDFIGAAALDQLSLCQELSAKYRIKRQAEREAQKARAEAEEKKRREETNRKAEQQIRQAIHVLQNGGVLENGTIRLYREDGSLGSYTIVNHLMRLYGVEVPLRTQGWINEKLVGLSIQNGRCDNLRYQSRKGSRCSEKIFMCIDALIEKIHAETEAAA